MLGARKWKPAPELDGPEMVSSRKMRLLGLPRAPVAATAIRPRLTSISLTVNVLLGLAKVMPPLPLLSLRFHWALSPALPPVILPDSVGKWPEVVSQCTNEAVVLRAISLGTESSRPGNSK